jgi:hypothetical protein
MYSSIMGGTSAPTIGGKSARRHLALVLVDLLVDRAPLRRREFELRRDAVSAHHFVDVGGLGGGHFNTAAD